MPADNMFDLHFPKGGVDVSRQAMSQPWRPGPPGVEGEPTRIYTTALARTVRAYDPITRRWRAGSGAALARYVGSPVVAGKLIQHLNTVVGVSSTAGTGTMQGSQLGRIVELVAVCQGRVFWASPTDDPDDRTLTESTNSASTTPPLSFAGVVRSTANNQKLWLVDGTRYRQYTPITHVVSDWAATAGSLPRVSGTTDGCRLITTYRGRNVLSGLIGDPANW